MGIRPNFQLFRQSGVAGLARRFAYEALVGDDAWPPTFQPPEDPSLRPVASGNVYVHLPFCETLCPHCPYNKAKADTGLISEYREALLREIRDYVEGRPDAPPVTSLYFGGGTPSLTPEIVADAISAFGPILSDQAEVAMEVYPSHATKAFFQEIGAFGVNRISLGIESLNPVQLKLLGRRYSPDAALRAVELGKAQGFEMVDVNLIFGIPGQQVETFREDVVACIGAGADQISAYPLFTFNHTPAGQPKQAERYAHADDRLRLRMQQGVAELTRNAGFRRTSVWSYTRDGRSPYTTVTRPDYVGFGAGAGSKGGGMALFNTFSIPEYVRSAPRSTALVYRLSERQRRADWLYWQVYNGRINASEYKVSFGVQLEEDFGGFLRLLRMIGFLRRAGDDYVLTDSGAIWVHRVQSLFSLNGIDIVWTTCMEEAWPEEVALA